MFVLILMGCKSGCDVPGATGVDEKFRTEIPDAPLPGLTPSAGSVPQVYLQALKQAGRDYVPRTHHLHENGKPKFFNRLIFQESPYLRQHAHNPVNWHPWSEEAFERAEAEGKMVFLSVGYSTCHWCHVMERESFEDEEIAAYINAHYIPIKVDREERPDVDKIYMSAVQMLVGRGGWPIQLLLIDGDLERFPFEGELSGQGLVQYDADAVPVAG